MANFRRNGAFKAIEAYGKYLKFVQSADSCRYISLDVIAVQLKEVASEEFRNYSKQVISNAKALGAALAKHGEIFITGGTDNHLLMWDVRPHDLTGSKVEKILDKMHITTNKNALVGDKS